MALAESGPVAVDLAGRSYIADLQPSEAGPVLAVTRDGAAFGNDEGLEAKRAAEAFCGSRGRIGQPCGLWALRRRRLDVQRGLRMKKAALMGDNLHKTRACHGISAASRRYGPGS